MCVCGGGWVGVCVCVCLYHTIINLYHTIYSLKTHGKTPYGDWGF